MERTALPEGIPLAFFEMSLLAPRPQGRPRPKLERISRASTTALDESDGFTWMEVLRKSRSSAMHIALTQTWSETALDDTYDKGSGTRTPRHERRGNALGRWLGFVRRSNRVAREKRGEKKRSPTNRITEKCGGSRVGRARVEIDPTASLAIRKFFERRSSGERSRWRLLRRDVRELRPGSRPPSKEV